MHFYNNVITYNIYKCECVLYAQNVHEYEVQNGHYMNDESNENIVVIKFTVTDPMMYFFVLSNIWKMSSMDHKLNS